MHICNSKLEAACLTTKIYRCEAYLIILLEYLYDFIILTQFNLERNLEIQTIPADIRIGFVKAIRGVQDRDLDVSLRITRGRTSGLLVPR